MATTNTLSSATNTDTQRKSRKRDETEEEEENDHIRTSSTDKDMLIEQLRHQIEEYFSEQNLQNDAQLRTQMTEDGYINISVLMNAKLISTLSTDRALIIESIRSSKRLKMNSQETMVRSVPLTERCTLILRDMPSEVGKEEILRIFAHPECGVVKEVRSDVGNTWFVKFHTEEECLKTVRYLQQNGSFRNKPLHVRVKSSNVYKALPVGDIGAIPPAPILDPADYDATFQMTGQDANPPDVPTSMDPALEPEIQSYDANRFYGYPMNAAYDYYMDSNEQAMFMPNPMDMNNKYQRQPRTTDFQSAEFMQRRLQREKRPNNNISDNKFMNERILANNLPPTMANEPMNQINPVGIGVTRKPPPLKQPETSDYPGTFLFYDKDVFLKVYQNMNSDVQLDIPSTMAGRDQRVISEKILIPISLFPPEEELEELSNVKITQETKTIPDDEEIPYDEAFEKKGDAISGKGRGWMRGRGGAARGNQARPGRGGLRNIRSFPGRQQQQQQQQQQQPQQKYYNTFEGSRNKNRTRNNNYYLQNNYSYNAYDYSSNYRASGSNNNNNNKGNQNNKNNNNNNSKRTSSKSGAETFVEKTFNQPRWVVAGSQTQKEEETQQNSNKTNKNNRRNQNSAQLKYVPKVTATEQQKYRPKAQPVS